MEHSSVAETDGLVRKFPPSGLSLLRCLGERPDPPTPGTAQVTHPSDRWLTPGWLYIVPLWYDSTKSSTAISKHNNKPLHYKLPHY